jgi:hypothetical protein
MNPLPYLAAAFGSLILVPIQDLRPLDKLIAEDYTQTVGVEVMTAGHHRHRGALRTRLLNNPQLLFDRVPHPRPSPPPQRISRNDLFSEDAHLVLYVDTYDVPT